MSRARTLLALVVALLVAAFARNSLAAEPTGGLAWDPSWTTFRPAEYVLTGAAGAVSLATYFFVKDSAQPHWTGGILFDDAVRDAIRLRSPGARDTIRTASDIAGVTTLIVAVGVDSLLVPLARKNDQVALQLTLMDAEAFAFSTLVTTSLYKAIGRARPSYEDCQRNPNFDPLCNTAPTASFPSGHSNLAFTAAGLSCAHHASLALYGSPLADAMGCAAMVTLAAATGTFRVMGDRHYVSDVLVGGLIGFGFGFGTPMLLHYGSRGRADATAFNVAPMGGAPGVVFSGTF